MSKSHKSAEEKKKLDKAKNASEAEQVALKSKSNIDKKKTTDRAEVDRVLPAVDPLSARTEVGNIIQRLEDAVRSVDGWLTSHLPDEAEGIRNHLIQARASLGEIIGLSTTKDGALVDPETQKKADSAINPDGSAKETANTAQNDTASSAPYDVTSTKNEDKEETDSVGDVNR